MHDFNYDSNHPKGSKPKKQKQLKKEGIMKNVNELYKNYYDAYKSNYYANDKLEGDEKKKFNYKQFELGVEINKEPKLDEKMEEFEVIDNGDQRAKSTKK